MGAKTSKEVNDAVKYWQKTTMSVPKVAAKFLIHPASLYRAIVRLKVKRVR